MEIDDNVGKSGIDWAWGKGTTGRASQKKWSGRRKVDVLIVQSAVSGLSQYCAAKLWSCPTIYSMGTFDREGGGKALGSKEGIEGGLQSWTGARNWPDPRQHCDKKESSWTFLTWPRQVVDIVWGSNWSNLEWCTRPKRRAKRVKELENRNNWLTDPYSRCSAPSQPNCFDYCPLSYCLCIFAESVPAWHYDYVTFHFNYLLGDNTVFYFLSRYLRVFQLKKSQC